MRHPYGSDSKLDADVDLLKGGGDGSILRTASSIQETVAYFEAAHTPQTGNAVYGNDASFLCGMTDVVLFAFRRLRGR